MIKCFYFNFSSTIVLYSLASSFSTERPVSNQSSLSWKQYNSISTRASWLVWMEKKSLYWNTINAAQHQISSPRFPIKSLSLFDISQQIQREKENFTFIFQSINCCQNVYLFTLDVVRTAINICADFKGWFHWIKKKITTNGIRIRIERWVDTPVKHLRMAANKRTHLLPRCCGNGSIS